MDYKEGLQQRFDAACNSGDEVEALTILQASILLREVDTYLGEQNV